MRNSAFIVALVAVVIAIAAFFFPSAGSNILGAVGSWTNYYGVSSAQQRVGSGCDDEFGTCTGTTVSGFNFGTCYVQSASATISASSTATVDCQASTNGTQSALTGVTTNDSVSVMFSTTTPTTYEGLQILGASASSTAGYITMKVFNGTGTTFTWTAAASTTQYRAWR